MQRYQFAPGQRAWEHSSSSDQAEIAAASDDGAEAAPQHAARVLPKITQVEQPATNKEDTSERLSDVVDALTLSAQSEADELEKTIVSAQIGESDATVVDALHVEDRLMLHSCSLVTQRLQLLLRSLRSDLI